MMMSDDSIVTGNGDVLTTCFMFYGDVYTHTFMFYDDE